jgi:hypothetical protein
VRNGELGTSERPGGASLRLLRESDADEVVALYRIAFGDARPIDAQEIVSWLR